MLDLTSYKSMLEAMNQLSAWLEEAKSHVNAPADPPKELVAQFEAALQEVESVSKAEAPVVTRPSDIIAESPLFSPKPVDTDLAHRPVMANQELITVTDQERNNVARGMQTLDAVHKPDELHAAQEIFKILSKDAIELSPADLLQLQSYAGTFSIAAEYGKKSSEGVSEVLETILDTEG